MDTETTIIPVTAAQREAVERMLRERALAPRLRERLEMVKAASLGADWEAIAAWSGRTPRTIRHWLTRFLVGGIPALTDAPRSGRPALPIVPIMRRSITPPSRGRAPSACRSMPGPRRG